MCWCSSRVQVWITVSSIYMETFPVLMRSQKMWSIINWNVTGEFVNPKNMTIGSNSPQFVQNAAFRLSPTLIQMLLYPHRMSSFVNIFDPLR